MNREDLATVRDTLGDFAGMFAQGVVFVAIATVAIPVVLVVSVVEVGHQIAGRIAAFVRPRAATL